MVVRKLKDDFGNSAIIEKIMCIPYKDAPKKEKAYRLRLTADYDNNMTYYVSIYQTLSEATNKLKEFSVGTFKEV